jgi:hypothetical protein
MGSYNKSLPFLVSDEQMHHGREELENKAGRQQVFKFVCENLRHFGDMWNERASTMPACCALRV